MAIRNNLLGGTDWTREHPTYQDMVETDNAIILNIPYNSLNLQEIDITGNQAINTDTYTDLTGSEIVVSQSGKYLIIASITGYSVHSTSSNPAGFRARITKNNTQIGKIVGSYNSSGGTGSSLLLYLFEDLLINDSIEIQVNTLGSAVTFTLNQAVAGTQTFMKVIKLPNY